RISNLRPPPLASCPFPSPTLFRSSSVLFPAPLRPMMPTTSPSWISRLTSRRAQNSSRATRWKGCLAREEFWALRDVNLEIHEGRSEEHTSELQSLRHLVCRLLLEK